MAGVLDFKTVRVFLTGRPEKMWPESQFDGMEAN
jgi:hypothetical protein